MNLVLFEPGELSPAGVISLPRTDPRAVHLQKILRRAEGDSFDAGIIDGPRGKAHVQHIGENALTLTFAADTPLPAASFPTLIVGLPRPQTARKILFEATTLGVSAIHFVATEKNDPNYASSTLWTSGEWRRHLIDAAQQAFDTRLPAVSWTHTLAQALALENVSKKPLRIALDNYEATASLRTKVPATPSTKPTVLAIGPERGWGPLDREQLRAANFTLAHLGTRVLRVETATTAALALLNAA